MKFLTTWARRSCGVVKVAALLALLFAENPAPAQTPDEHVGVCTHFSQGWDVARTMPLIAALGVGWIRDDQAWGEVEPQAHHYIVPPRLTEWVNAAHAHHLKVLLMFGYGNRAYPDPFSPEAYAQAAAFVATHVPHLDALEVLNEPNNADFYAAYGGAWNGNEANGSVSPYVSAYAKLLRATVAAVKQANPHLLVVGYGAPAPATFRMIALGAPTGLDGITDHPYSEGAHLPELIPYAATPDMLKRDGLATADVLGTYASQCDFFRRWAAAHGLHAALWNTEWGFSTTQSPAHPEDDLSRDAQANYIVRRLLEARALQVQTFYYIFKDEGHDPAVKYQNYGLVDEQLQEKPAYAAFQRFTQVFAKLQGDGTSDGFSLQAGPSAPGTVGNRCYAYHDPDNAGKWIACWKVEPWPSGGPASAATLILPDEASWRHATRIDLLTGAQSPLTWVGQKPGRRSLAITLDADPCVIHLFD
jgi:hypothetical protein